MCSVNTGKCCIDLYHVYSRLFPCDYFHIALMNVAKSSVQDWETNYSLHSLSAMTSVGASHG